MLKSYFIRLAKEDFKFSCAHFTVFSQTRGERLHGHNYQVSLEIELDRINPATGMAFDFNLIKPKVRQICKKLDEAILIAERAPQLKIKKRARQLEVQFSARRYSFPAQEVQLLPVVNVTSEELANWIAMALLKSLGSSFKFQALTVTVEETRGQSASCQIKNQTRL